MRSVSERRPAVVRECDNDNCEYETGVGPDGRPRVWWVHVPECDGPVNFTGDSVMPEEYKLARASGFRRMLTRD